MSRFGLLWAEIGRVLVVTRPPFRGAGMSAGATISITQIDVYHGAGRAGRSPQLVYAGRYLNAAILRLEHRNSWANSDWVYQHKAPTRGTNEPGPPHQ